MKNGYLKAVIALAIVIFPGFAQAQYIPVSGTAVRYSQNKLVILSDSNTRSSLLCNLLADRAGSQSPLIGTGTWQDNEKPVQVSSLLYFDLSAIEQIRPEDIAKAWLLMVPASTSIEQFNSSTARVRIRRVIEPWDDSTSWSKQPAITSQYGYNYTLDRPDTNNYYHFNVTRLLRQMIKNGNYGFEISYSEKDGTQPFGRLYYSPKVEDSLLRPLLLIQVDDQVVAHFRYNVAREDWITDFSKFNQTVPMYDRRQMLEYMRPPNVQPAAPAVTPVAPVTPPKSDN